MAVLYIVSTPIGNLEDISLRAIRILKEVDLILCEDTRVTKKLLARYEIQKPTTSYHQHSRLSKLKQILSELEQGKNLALVSDAGTPSISDPGAKLVAYLLEELPDLRIIPIPGSSACLAALAVSGFPADKFVFLGFPPNRRKRQKFFKGVLGSKRTVVFYESPHRILKTLRELEKLNAERPASDFGFKIVVCRELTKMFEKIYRGDIQKIIEELEKEKKMRGEFAVVTRRFKKN